MISALSRQTWLHRLLAASHVYPMAEALLARRPIVFHVPSSEFVYRVTSLDQFAIRAEIFQDKIYSRALEASEVNSFIDLGCNAGWFALWLYSEATRAELAGLLVDGHPRMVEEARWHLNRNRLAGSSVVHGVVGMSPDVASGGFFLHPSASQSSLIEYHAGSRIPPKGTIRKVDVPAVIASQLWVAEHGGRKVDLLKLDIEGSELNWIRGEAGFLSSSVRKMVVEYHTWAVQEEELRHELRRHGFRLRSIWNQDARGGLALYDNLAFTP